MPVADMFPNIMWTKLQQDFPVAIKQKCGKSSKFSITNIEGDDRRIETVAVRA